MHNKLWIINQYTVLSAHRYTLSPTPLPHLYQYYIHRIYTKQVYHIVVGMYTRKVQYILSCLAK